MKYVLEPEVLRATTSCVNNFSCLSGEDKCICEIERYIGDEEGVLFVNKKSDIASCKYCMSFGSSFVCNCPVRKKIYKNYSV